jgi:hypothetical protein
MKAPTASEPVKPDFKRNYLLHFLLVLYLALWSDVGQKVFCWEIRAHSQCRSSQNY